MLAITGKLKPNTPFIQSGTRIVWPNRLNSKGRASSTINKITSHGELRNSWVVNHENARNGPKGEICPNPKAAPAIVPISSVQNEIKTLNKNNPDIEKCLFVVDRKDLDRQTREEFNKFQEGSVEENTNTETLVRRLLSTDYADKVIVTTIQKLGLALDGSQKKNYKYKTKKFN